MLKYNDPSLGEGAGWEDFLISASQKVCDARGDVGALLIHPASPVHYSFGGPADATHPTITGLLMLSGPDAWGYELHLYAPEETKVRVGRKLAYPEQG